MSPSRLSSRKNAFVPSTCCAYVGRGSRSNSATIALLPPVIAPVGLPAASRSSLPPAGRSAVALDPELREARVGQERPAVAELHVDGATGRRGLELGLRRPPPLRELQLVPAARNDQPCAGLARARGGADSRECLGQRARADPVHLARERERGADRVQVRVDQTRGSRRGRRDRRCESPDPRACEGRSCGRAPRPCRRGSRAPPARSRARRA